jgi:glycosyltransferase involved in cell wall biosynthesis
LGCSDVAVVCAFQIQSSHAYNFKTRENQPGAYTRFAIGRNGTFVEKGTWRKSDCGPTRKLSRSLAHLVCLENKSDCAPQKFSVHESQSVDTLGKKACEESDVIIAVVEEMKTRLVSQHQFNADKVVVVSNTEEKTFINQQLDNTVYQNLSGKFILAYTGGIGPHRGVDVAIKGMSHISNPQNIHLVIVGFGSNAVMQNLQQLVTERGLNNVHFLGYQPFTKFFSYMTLADVNVIPHQSNGHTDHTIPHKLFQGMMTGKPILVSSSAPLKRVVETCNSGLVFKAGDENDFAKKVDELYLNKELCATLGANGKKATLGGDLNWEHEQEILLNLYTNY